MSELYSKSKFITGLRAYSALMILFIHSGGGGLRSLGGFGNHIVDFGKYGVAIFFIMSAFTISMSVDNARFDYSHCLLKRFLRIAPLYYPVLIVCFFLGVCIAFLQQFGTENNFNGSTLNNVFENSISQYLGKISYSIYLVHYPVVEYFKNYLTGLPLLIGYFAAIVLISSITYKFIEEPFISLGKKQKAPELSGAVAGISKNSWLNLLMERVKQKR